jgi:hypothetical protein
MGEQVNQAVLFTKPLHHVDVTLSPEDLAHRSRTFFEGAGFRIIQHMEMTGAELRERDAIREHYLMYSRAACAPSTEELGLTDEGRERFAAAFGKEWGGESGKVLTSPALQRQKGVGSHELYLLWNEQFSAGLTCKVQEGIIIARLQELDCYCINAFYPAMEENFYHPDTRITYYVLEFDAGQVSWEQFRKRILGATDASKAPPGSFRGRLYAEYPVAFPGRDNFVHGSAGPLEGLVERMIHEPGFDMADSPVGRYLLERGISQERFRTWKSGCPVKQLGEIFDITEEKNTGEALAQLDTISFA